MEVMRLWGLVPDSIGGVETVFGLVRADFWVCTMLCVTLRAPHQEESRIVRRDSAIFPWVDAVLAVRICPPPVCCMALRISWNLPSVCEIWGSSHGGV